jgi:hypothetical protein
VGVILAGAILVMSVRVVMARWVMIVVLRRHGGADLADRMTRRPQRAEEDAPLHL